MFPANTKARSLDLQKCLHNSPRSCRSSRVELSSRRALDLFQFEVPLLDRYQPVLAGNHPEKGAARRRLV